METLTEKDIHNIQRVVGNAQKTIMDLEHAKLALEAKVASLNDERDVLRGMLLLADAGEDSGELIKKTAHYISHPTELSERISGFLARDTNNMLSQGVLKVSDTGDGGSQGTSDVATNLYLRIRAQDEEVQ